MLYNINHGSFKRRLLECYDVSSTFTSVKLVQLMSRTSSLAML